MLAGRNRYFNIISDASLVVKSVFERINCSCRMEITVYRTLFVRALAYFLLWCTCGLKRLKRNLTSHAARKECGDWRSRGLTRFEENLAPPPWPRELQWYWTKVNLIRFLTRRNSESRLVLRHWNKLATCELCSLLDTVRRQVSYVPYDVKRKFWPHQYLKRLLAAWIVYSLDNFAFIIKFAAQNVLFKI